MGESGVKRLNWGCGSWREPGWINSDRWDEAPDGPGLFNCDTPEGFAVPEELADKVVILNRDIHRGLTLEDDSMDYVVSIHALPEIPYDDQLPVLRELKRVLKPGGTLRLGLPDLEKGFRAYEQNNRGYFKIEDDVMESIGGKLIVQLIWFGHSRTPFVYDFIRELLAKAGYRNVRRCEFKQTESRHPGIVELDNREDESLFVEAEK